MQLTLPVTLIETPSVIYSKDNYTEVCVGEEYLITCYQPIQFTVKLHFVRYIMAENTGGWQSAPTNTSIAASLF